MSLATTLAVGCGGKATSQSPTPGSEERGEAASIEAPPPPTAPEAKEPGGDVTAPMERSDEASQSFMLSVKPSPSRLGGAPDPGKSPEKQARCLEDAIGYAEIADDLRACLGDAGFDSDAEIRVEIGIELSFEAVRIRGEAPSALQSCVHDVFDGARKKLHAYCYSTRAVLLLHWNAQGVVGHGSRTRP
jgi:hypothetical protein